MTLLLLELPFSATHQIEIQGELEPVHGHDFRCLAEIECRDERDAGLLAPLLAGVLAELSHSHLQEVERGEGGRASAERIARHLHRKIQSRLEPGLRVAAVTVHESWGCSASFR